MKENEKHLDNESRWRIALDSIASIAQERRQWEQKYWDLQLKLLHLYDGGPRGWWERFLFIFCFKHYRNRKRHFVNTGTCTESGRK